MGGDRRIGGEIFESELGISAGLVCEGRRRETRGRRRLGSAPCHGRGGLKISGSKISATGRGEAAREGESWRGRERERSWRRREGWVVADWRLEVEESGEGF